MGYSVLVYCNMFFRGAKPRRCQSFRHFGHRLSHNNDALLFMFNVFTPFNPSVYGLLWTKPEFFQFTSVAFQKVFDPKSRFSFFRRFFFKFHET